MVRQQVGLGRILPLGGRHDGAWIAERAAGTALRRTVEREVPEVRVDGLRLGLADDLEEAPEPAVPAPPSALPPGPLRLTAEFAATAAWPLPETASRLRTALAVAAAERLGLAVEEVDLRATELLDTEPDPPPSASDASDAQDAPDSPDVPDTPADRSDAAGTDGVGRAGDAETDRVAAAVLAVPGVSRLTGTWGRPVRLSEPPAGGGALPRRHARVDLAVGAGFRPLEVARAVRAAVAASLPDRPTVAVLVTDLD